MQEEMEAGTNRPLTNLGIVQQLRLLVENLDTKHQKIGMFGEETLSVGSNPIVFREDFDRLGKIHILNLCDEYIDQAGYLGVRR